MRFRENKPHDKYGCADGFCRCGAIRDENSEDSDDSGGSDHSEDSGDFVKTKAKATEKKADAGGLATTPRAAGVRWRPGKLANDGSLDMRFRENKPHDKYGCADGFCRCGAI